MPKNETVAPALEAEIKALKDLIEVARSVVSTLDLDTVLQAILTSAMRFAGTPAGSVALYDDLNRELTLHAHAGLTADFVRKERWTVAPGGLTEHVLNSKVPVYVENTEETTFFNNPIALNEGIKSLICIPLIIQERILGILYLDDFVSRTFEQKKADLLSVLASFAAMAIDNAKLHRRTRLMAITDSLTGLYNYRYFHQVLTQEMERARRYGKPLALIMMDVDDFKLFNDTYGHPVGDKVLEKVGKVIAQTLRSADSAFRYGGEEFIAILPETPLDSALRVAERLRLRVETEGAAGLGITGRVTVSMGVAAYPRDGVTPLQLLDRVDALLYSAKSSGKNMVYSD